MIIVLQMLIFFRESLVATLDRLIRPYYKHFSLSLPFYKYENSSDDGDSEEQVFAEFDDEKGVVFFPPMCSQRYAAVCDCLMDERWCGKLEKVVDLGYHDISFIKYLKDVPGIKSILGVDIESVPIRCSSDLIFCNDYLKHSNPIQITLFQGNAADPDYRLIGCDAVIAIEMIEHILPHDLDRIVHTVFGFIKPWVAVFTTPNADFNVLFKSLEKNGLRRLDHYFEWTREQFHDWCSNIVTRYPQYTVSCRGIGPGPPGTEHLGCCSQLALFMSKNYHKQRDLNLNSLALVGNSPRSDSMLMTDTIGDWISVEDITSIRDLPRYKALQSTSNMLFTYPSSESFINLLNSNKQSCWTFVIASPAFSLDTQGCRDKTSQCNIDTETERNFMMFNDAEMCFTFLMPRRKNRNRIYEIQDVTSRLNCTSLQVRKFSKTTQDMMAKNQIDQQVHVREVVDKIRDLTKILNLNKENLNQGLQESYTWANFNWGENAPYWNQYYKVVKEYNYPFEVKSDESRIFDLVSQEINKQIDLQYDEEEFASDGDMLEIPIAHLMGIVQDVTDDRERVKDLLEWNGYEIVGDMVIHRRLALEEVMVANNDIWKQEDSYSDVKKHS